MQYVLQVEQPGNSCQSITVILIQSYLGLIYITVDQMQYILQVGQLVNSVFFPS